MEQPTFTVRRLELGAAADRDALYDLRFRVLREPLGLPRGTERIAEDDGPATVHVGAVTADGRLVGCASLIPHKGLQLRAMAVDPAFQGQGVGAAVLRAAEDAARERVLPLWCEARKHAVGFYAKAGWRVEGEEFVIPKIGPHFVMRCPSASDRTLAAENSEISGEHGAESLRP